MTPEEALQKILALCIECEGTCLKTGDTLTEFCEAQGCDWYVVDRDELLAIIKSINPSN